MKKVFEQIWSGIVLTVVFMAIAYVLLVILLEIASSFIYGWREALAGIKGNWQSFLVLFVVLFLSGFLLSKRYRVNSK